MTSKAQYNSPQPRSAVRVANRQNLVQFNDHIFITEAITASTNVKDYLDLCV